MAVRPVHIFDEQTGITAISDAFLIDPAAQISLMAVEESAGAATIQTTVDPHETVAVDMADWISSPGGEQTNTFAESSTSPITAVRLNVASGTWTLKVLQVKDTGKEA